MQLGKTTSKATIGESINLTSELYQQLNILIKGHTTYPQCTRVSDEDSFILLSNKVAIIYSLQKKTPKLSTWPTSVYSRLSNKTDLQPGTHIDKGIRAGPHESACSFELGKTLDEIGLSACSGQCRCEIES